MPAREPIIKGSLLSRPVASRHGVFFWLLRTLVKVRYSFFLTALLLGLRRTSLLTLAVWVAVVFVAVLLHELGHALAARFYRQAPQIELHAMGGTTSWTWIDDLRWHQRIVISLAGPGIGFVAGGLGLLGSALSPFHQPALLHLARYDVLWVTIGWGLFNLLPILPLDGGHVLREILEHRLGRQPGQLLSRKVSCVVGVLGLVAGVASNQLWVAILCAIFAFDSLQRMRGLPGVALPR